MEGKGRFGPLTERPFRLLWLGRTGSAVGDSLIPVALAFAVLHIGGGATGLGIVLALFTIGRASFIVIGGVWADRLPRRLVMIGADLVRFGTQATTAALLLGGVAHVWELACLQGLAGAAGGFFMPASTALVPQAVSSGRLQQANALLALSQSATNIFGPALSGAIVAGAGAGTVFAIDAASYLVSVAFLIPVRVEDPPAKARSAFWSDVFDGWREVRRHRWLTAGFLGFALGNVGIGLYFVLGPIVAAEHLGGARAWGLILAAGAVGGVLGGLAAYRIRVGRPVASAFIVWSFGSLSALALVPPLALPAVMAASAVFSISIIVGNTFWETAMQQEVQPDRLARVSSIDWLLSLCLMPLGQGIAGALAAGLGVRATLVLAAALMAVPNLVVLAFVPEIRAVKRRNPSEFLTGGLQGLGTTEP
jgi:MFS family permease